MASYIEKGDSIFIPFGNGRSISDSQCRPRMYKSLQNFEKSFPTHNLVTENIELVEYKEVVHGEWSLHPDGSGTCNRCGRTQKSVWDFDNAQSYCGECGAKMDGERKDT